MLTKHTADDDSESQKRTDVQSPEVCVDYLSYTFDEMDLAASWRVMTKQKKDIVNGIRLENASWRTWTKQRNHLKTISPETLNWLKDSDVTWLYGPLHTVTKTDHHHDRYAPKESSAHDKLGLIHPSDPPLTDKGITGACFASATVTRTPSFPLTADPNVNCQATSASTSTPASEQEQQLQLQHQQQQQQQERRPLKSALKKVTMSDILRRSASEFHVSDLNHHSGGSSISLSEANRQLGVFSPAVVATHRQPKLRFNQRVEQYMVISDDDGSSANGSIHKVKMTANLPSHYDATSSDYSASSAVNDSTADGRLLHAHRDDSDTDDDEEDDDLDGTIHRYRGRRDSRYIVKNNNDSKDNSDDIDGDDDDDDDYGIVMHHHHHSSPMTTHLAPRSIKRIEPAVLKSSSYSDASVTSSRRGSLSSWDDDDNDSDRRSVHLPDYQLHRPTPTHTPDQSSIQWEGQSSVVYDVAPSETESDFVEDDWDLRRESFDNNTIDDDNSENGMIGTGVNDTAENSVTTGKSWQKLPMRLDLPDPSHDIDTPAIISPRKTSKSIPTNEQSTVDAAYQQSSSSSSSPSPSSIVDQHQTSSTSSVFGNLGQWASSYFWK